MKKLLIALFVTILSTKVMALEPRLLKPELDGEFIGSLGLSHPADHQRFNLLLIGYDSPLAGTENSRASRAYTNGRQRRGLTSRSDIMMVLSFDKARRQIDILSVGRDYEPAPNCWDRAPDWMKSGKRNKGGSKINGAVVLYGRRIMLHCLRSVITENLANTPYSGEFSYESDGLFPIHSILEFERGRNADSSVIGKLKDRVLENFMSTISVIWTYSDAMDTMGHVIGRYGEIFNGLKRRDYAVSGSYQRAFNNAKFVADAIGWTAPGVQSTKSDGYDFVAWELFSPVNDIAGATHTLEELNVLLSYYPNGREKAVDNMFRYGGFVDNPGTGEPTRVNPFLPTDPVSPVRVIQFGGTPTSYAVFQNGFLDLSGARRKSFLSALRIRPVFQKPGETVLTCPECHVQPNLPAGGWGLPYLLGLQ